MAIRDTVKLVEQASEYKYGFTTDIEQEFAPKGLNEEIIKFISKKKKEPTWLLQWRLKAYSDWKKKENMLPKWANLKYDKIDFQDIHYFAAPKSESDKPKSLEEVDPELLRAYNKLGIPLKEQEFLAGISNSHKVAVDAVLNSFVTKFPLVLLVKVPNVIASSPILAAASFTITFTVRALPEFLYLTLTLSRFFLLPGFPKLKCPVFILKLESSANLVPYTYTSLLLESPPPIKSSPSLVLTILVTLDACTIISVTLCQLCVSNVYT